MRQHRPTQTAEVGREGRGREMGRESNRVAGRLASGWICSFAHLSFTMCSREPPPSGKMGLTEAQLLRRCCALYWRRVLGA